MSFNSKWFISDIHWISTGGKPNPNGFGAPNLKTVGEKPATNPNPQNPKPADIRPKPDPLCSMFFYWIYSAPYINIFLSINYFTCANL